MEDLQLLINKKQTEILERKAYLNSTEDYAILDETVMLRKKTERERVNRLELEIRELEQEIIEMVTNQEVIL